MSAASYPALVKRKNVLYFAHPIFKAYNKSGNYVLEKYAEQAIRSFYDEIILTKYLPSCARVRLRESNDGNFLALHVLYAPPVNRGNVCLLPDFPTLHGVEVSIKTDKAVKKATLSPENVSVPFEQMGDRIVLHLPPFHTHALITLELET